MICPDCSTQPRIPARRLIWFTGAATPGFVLALVPKCPACVAGYVAAATGVSISFTAAQYLRGAVIAVCAAAMVGLLLAFALRGGRTPLTRRRIEHLTSTHLDRPPNKEPNHACKP